MRRWLVVVLVLVLAGTVVLGAALSGPDAAQESLPELDPCNGQPLKCVMTFSPGVRGVPLIREDLQFPDPYGRDLHGPATWAVATRYGSAAAYVEFYETYMPTHGWHPLADETRLVSDPSGVSTQYMGWDRPDGVRVRAFVSNMVDPQYGNYIVITINEM